MGNSYSRRSFIKSTLAGASGIFLLANCGNLKISNWNFFTEEEAAAIEAMFEQIIPTDKDPGAKEANVINFIDKQLVSHYSRHQHIYRTGIAGLQETSQIMFGKTFEKLKWAEQYEIMLALESNKAKGETWVKLSSSKFFNLVKDHTMQGFYGSPRHGGNKDYVSYRMLGLDAPLVIGQNRYH